LGQAVRVRSSDGGKVRFHSLRSDRHGRFWGRTTAGLVRFDDEGRVDRILGDDPSTDSLRRVGLVHVDARGTTYALSAGSGILAVIGTDGKRLRTHRLLAGDYEYGPCGFETRLVTDADGSVLYGEGATLSVVFGRDGGATRLRDGRHDAPAPLLLFQPKRDRAWHVSGTLTLAQRNGTPLKIIEKDAQGRWLTFMGPGAVAPDGSIAIPATSRWDRSGSIHVVSSDASSIRSLDTASGIHSGVAWDGARLAYGNEGRLHLLDVDSARERVFPLIQPGRDEVTVESVHFVSRKREIWVFDGVRRMYRYACP